MGTDPTFAGDGCPCIAVASMQLPEGEHVSGIRGMFPRKKI